MHQERRIRTRTPEWRALYDRIQVAMELTSRLNVLPFSDIDSRNALLTELLGKPLPEKTIIHPPFYSTYGLGIELGERTFVGQACSFLDLGGITIGDRSMISPKGHAHYGGPPDRAGSAVRLHHRGTDPHRSGRLDRRGGHDPSRRADRPGAVAGAGAVVAKDVPALTVVSGTGSVERKQLNPAPDPTL